MKIKSILYNKKARYNYIIYDKFEAGIVLTGTEIKAIKEYKVQIVDSYISFINNEIYIKGLHIGLYKQANQFNHQEVRDRKLLLHKKEISKLKSKSSILGYTIIPLHIYLSNGLAKLEIALCKGKKLYDKRYSEKVKTMNKIAQRNFKYNNS